MIDIFIFGRAVFYIKTLHSRCDMRLSTSAETTDLIEPLFVIAKNAELLKEQLGTGVDKKTKNLIEDIERAVVDISAIVDQLMTSDSLKLGLTNSNLK